MTKFSNLTKIDRSYSPDNWSYVISNPEGAYLNYTPRLMDLDDKFGNSASADWIKKQVLSIWLIKPDTNDVVGIQANMWAKVFAKDNKTRNLGELMVFFGRCMLGKYPCGYSFDLTRLGEAFERFKNDWYYETMQYEESRKERERDEQAKKDKESGMTLQQWLDKQKKLGNKTNLEAKSVEEILSQFSKNNINQNKQNG